MNCSELLEQFNCIIYNLYIISLHKLCYILYPLIKDICFIFSYYENKTKYIDYDDYLNLTAKRYKIDIISINDNIKQILIFKLKNRIYPFYMNMLYYLSRLFYPIIKDIKYALLIVKYNFTINDYSPKYDIPSTNNNLIDNYKYKLLKYMYDTYIYFLYKIIILFCPLIRDIMIVSSIRNDVYDCIIQKNNIKSLDYLNLENEFRVTKNVKRKIN